MRNPDRVTWELVQQWLASAREDLDVAEELMGRQRLSYNPVGFHAQQAAEKFLKALLTRHRIPFPKTHNIEALVLLAENAEKGIHYALREAHSLTPYGVDIRYPGENPPLDRDGGVRAVRLAASVRDTVIGILASYLEAGKADTGQ
jgi:HEPN domain-containing protein